MVLKIYEFGRGIKVAGTPDSWHSQGFTGELMNCTFNPVPQAIKTAISNRLFAVAERGATDTPALVGREVEDEDGQWSVMAVVNRGWDDGGRPFSAYRYFWCDGHDNLVDIAHWWWTIKSKEKRELVFDPFDVPKGEITIENEQRYGNREHDITAGNFSDLTNEALPIPVIVGFDRTITPVILDRIANKKVGNDLLAWAYNVEALEVPRSFQAIFPASQQAGETIRRVISNQSNVSNSVQEESTIKKAISLLSQNKVKPEHLKTIEDALSNPAIDDKYWRSMFDSQGATDAIKQGNYGHSMIRLLTLQAMVLPEKLLEFLCWLMAKEKQTDKYDISADFQSKIVQYDLSYCPKLSERIYEGVVLIIPEILDNPKLLSSLAWLLKSKNGCWGAEYQNNMQNDLEKDFCHFKECSRKRKYENLIFLEYEKWGDIYNKIISCWIYNRSCKDEKYEVLGILFNQIGSYKFSALFYHASLGCVPPDIFSALDGADRFGNHITNKIYGLKIKKQLNLPEIFWYSEILGKNQMRLPIFTFIFLLCYALGWFGGFFANKLIFSAPEKSMRAATEKIIGNDDQLSKQKKEIQKNLIDIVGSDELPKKDYFNDLKKEIVCKVNQDNGNYFCGISEEKMNNAVTEFATTKKALKSIENKLVKVSNPTSKNKYTTLEIQEKFAKEIGVDDVNILNKAINSNGVTQDQKVVVYKIYKYQEKYNISPTGILDEKTKSQLLKEIIPVSSFPSSNSSN
jgi:hypothetical protein